MTPRRYVVPLAKMGTRAATEIMVVARDEEGFPTHPLARGKGFVPLDRKPEVWTS